MKLQILIASATKLLVNRLIPLMAGLALLVFFYGLFQSIAKAGDKAGVEAGKNLMVWGVIALFVMLSAWGLVKFIQSGLNLSGFSL